jgi:hypothetical protein
MSVKLRVQVKTWIMVGKMATVSSDRGREILLLWELCVSYFGQKGSLPGFCQLLEYDPIDLSPLAYRQ